MVAGAQSSHLVLLSLQRLVRDLARLRAGHAATFLHEREVAFPSVTLIDCPAGAAAQHIPHRPGVEVNLAPAAQAGRHGAKESVRQLLLSRLYLGKLQARVKR